MYPAGTELRLSRCFFAVEQKLQQGSKATTGRHVIGPPGSLKQHFHLLATSPYMKLCNELDFARIHERPLN